MKKLSLLLLVLIAGVSTSAFAISEPAFCEPSTFLKSERAFDSIGINRGHLFQIGELTLVGMGVGRSEPPLVRNLALLFGRGVPASKGYCTWYLNRGNERAEKMFNHRYVEKPLVLLPNWGLAERYMDVLETSFLSDETGAASFVDCAVNHGYVALGCKGMQHRGPSVFAMLLSFAGCHPLRTVEIVRGLWGDNFISPIDRILIAAEAYRLGNEHPSLRAELVRVMTAPTPAPARAIFPAHLISSPGR